MIHVIIQAMAFLAFILILWRAAYPDLLGATMVAYGAAALAHIAAVIAL